MIVNDNDAVARLNSPLNLINRLKTISSSSPRKDAMSLFGINRRRDSSREDTLPTASIPKKPAQFFNPFQESAKSQASHQNNESQSEIPVLDEILENHESQIKLGLAHDSALKLLNASIDALATKLDDVKADKLSSVISAASKTVESIRRERVESAKNGKDREVHYHFYTPIQKKIDQYEVIDVS